MKALEIAQNVLTHAIDTAMGFFPTPTPDPSALAACRVVAHRGAHDFNTGTYKENTLAAFDRAAQSGIWGVEFDVRWTRDLVPVVHHDPTTERVFGRRLNLAETEFEILHKAIPEIPTLNEVLQRYRKRLHFMIELKSSSQPLTSKQLLILEQELGALVPGQDFHLISLNSESLLQSEFISKAFRIPVAELNIKDLSRITLHEGLGGLMGHYALMTQTLVSTHHQSQQKIGTGFAKSRSVLFREINRGVDWIFSNHAPEMQKVIQDELQKIRSNDSGSSRFF